MRQHHGCCARPLTPDPLFLRPLTPSAITSASPSAFLRKRTRARYCSSPTSTRQRTRAPPPHLYPPLLAHLATTVGRRADPSVLTRGNAVGGPPLQAGHEQHQSPSRRGPAWAASGHQAGRPQGGHSDQGRLHPALPQLHQADLHQREGRPGEPTPHIIHPIPHHHAPLAHLTRDTLII